MQFARINFKKRMSEQTILQMQWYTY